MLHIFCVPAQQLLDVMLLSAAKGIPTTVWTTSGWTYAPTDDSWARPAQARRLVPTPSRWASGSRAVDGLGGSWPVPGCKVFAGQSVPKFAIQMEGGFPRALWIFQEHKSYLAIWIIYSFFSGNFTNHYFCDFLGTYVKIGYVKTRIYV